MDRHQLESWLERAILGLVGLILLFGPLAYGSVQNPKTLLNLGLLFIQPCVILIALLWLLRLWVTAKAQLYWPPHCWALLFFLGYALVRLFFVEVDYPAHAELIEVLVYTTLFFAVQNNLQNQRQVQGLIYLLLALGACLSGFALFQFITHWDKIWFGQKYTQYVPRGSGTYFNPNNFAGFAETLLFLGMAFTLLGRLKHVTRILIGYATIIILVGVGVSISRGAWLAVALTLIVFFIPLLKRRRFRYWALLTGLIVVLVGATLVYKSGAVQTRFVEMLADGTPDHYAGRLWIWKATASMWRDHLWFGVGPGQFDVFFPSYRPIEIQTRPTYAHNDYLNLLAEWGLLGFALISAFWLAMVVGSLRTWKHIHQGTDESTFTTSNRSAWVLGASTGVLALLIHSLFDFNMQIPSIAIQAVVLTALLSAQFRFSMKRCWKPLNLGGKVAISALLVALSVYLSLDQINRTREYRWVQRARNADKNIRWQDRMDYEKKAHMIAPTNYKTIHRIGEHYRIMAFGGFKGYEALAAEAIEWYRKGQATNPKDTHNYLRHGMCLDYLDKHAEAEAYYIHAVESDPHNHFLQWVTGWHYFQAGDFEKAKTWLTKSWDTKPWDNDDPLYYLKRIEEIEAESKNHSSNRDR